MVFVIIPFRKKKIITADEGSINVFYAVNLRIVDNVERKK